MCIFGSRNIRRKSDFKSKRHIVEDEESKDKIWCYHSEPRWIQGELPMTARRAFGHARRGVNMFTGFMLPSGIDGVQIRGRQDQG